MGGGIECPICGNNQAYCKCTRLEKEQFLEIARLRYSLMIYWHAHSTGNSVPPHLEAKAFALVKDLRAKNPSCPPADRL